MQTLPSPPAPPICRRGLCLVLAAPSGAGKSTISRALLAADSQLTLSISATTRAPRTGEQEGTHYFFCDQPAFDGMARSGELLEHATVFGRSYGTPRAPVLASLSAGRDVLFDIDWQGFRQLRGAIGEDTIGVFILPPSLEALRARLTGRDDAADQVAARMAEAGAEISHWHEFDHLVLNDDLPAAIAEVLAILHAGRSARARRPDLAARAQAMAAN